MISYYFELKADIKNNRIKYANSYSTCIEENFDEQAL